MGGTISLTPLQQHELTIALRLEQAGFTAAAKYLRDSIGPLRGIRWEDITADHVEDEKAWMELFRKHRGSFPPREPMPAVHHGAPVPPITVPTPSPRPDQPTAIGEPSRGEVGHNIPL